VHGFKTQRHGRFDVDCAVIDEHRAFGGHIVASAQQLEDRGIRLHDPLAATDHKTFEVPQEGKVGLGDGKGVLAPVTEGQQGDRESGELHQNCY